MHLIVLRGLPGSGKTTLANKISEKCDDVIIISNDKLRSKNGNYKYNRHKNNSIYHHNYKLLIDSMLKKIRFIIIDNCNININLLNNYYNLSIKYNYNYYQLAFPKPSQEDLFLSYQKSNNKISISQLRNLWLNYHHHHMDKDTNSINFTMLNNNTTNV